MNWRKKATCFGSEVNFHGKNTAPAKLICQTCPVTQECLAWAVKMERHDGIGMDGVWGSLPEQERRSLFPLKVIA